MGAYSDWGKEQFGYYQGSVIFLEVEKEDKEKGIGTAFHIGDRRGNRCQTYTF